MDAPKVGDKANHDFRFHFELTKPVRRAALYVTGQDSPAAWINGKQILQSEPRPAWDQFPWKTYKVRDAANALRAGKNTLAIQIVRYGGPPIPTQTPMSAVLYVESTDGTAQTFKSDPQGWRATLNASGNWQAADFDDAQWSEAVRVIPSSAAEEPSELGNAWPTGAVKSLRRTFEISKPIASARIYATALGAYKLSINGRGVGDEILAPGWTDFRQRVVYQAFDVTGDLKSGKNAVAALLAPGWYSTPLLWFQQANNYGSTPPALRAQLRIAYTDGSVEWILTDEKWKADSSPTLRAEIYDGENYDARKAQANWDAATFDDSRWKPVEIIQPKETQIVWQYFPPIRAEKTIEAKKVTNPAPGVYIFDFAQNLSGVARIRAQGAAGTDIKMRFAEVLNPDGSAYTDNLRTAKATDHFILAGKGVEEFQPNFTFHGFRYVEITGLKTAATAAGCESRCVSHGRSVYHHAEYRQCNAESTLEKYSVGPALKFRGSAHRLPAARRAAGLDGRRASILAHRQLQHGPDKFLAEVRQPICAARKSAQTCTEFMRRALRFQIPATELDGAMRAW